MGRWRVDCEFCARDVGNHDLTFFPLPSLRCAGRRRDSERSDLDQRSETTPPNPSPAMHDLPVRHLRHSRDNLQWPREPCGHARQSAAALVTLMSSARLTCDDWTFARSDAKSAMYNAPNATCRRKCSACDTIGVRNALPHGPLGRRRSRRNASVSRARRALRHSHEQKKLLLLGPSPRRAEPSFGENTTIRGAAGTFSALMPPPSTPAPAGFVNAIRPSSTFPYRIVSKSFA